MNFSTMAFTAPAESAALAVSSSPPVSVLVVAVSDDTVTLSADRIYVDLDTSPPTWRADDRKVFRGDHLVTGIVGVMDAPSMSLGQAVQAAAKQPTITDALTAFAGQTTPWLPELEARWRAAMGPSEPLAALATVIVGGIHHGRPTAIQLNPARDSAGLYWTPAPPLEAVGRDSYVGAYGVVDATLRAATTRYAASHPFQASPGPAPTPRPVAGVHARDLLEHALGLATAAVAREAAVPRPPGWPAHVPVLAGDPHIVALTR